MDADRNRRIVLDYLAAVARGDRAAAEQAFAEDAVWSYPASLGGPGAHRGRDAIFDVYFAQDEQLYATGTRSYELDVRCSVAEGDRVVVELVHRDTTLDGRPYENPELLLFELEDGRIRAVREYFDSLHFRRMFPPGGGSGRGTPDAA